MEDAGRWLDLEYDGEVEILIVFDDRNDLLGRDGARDRLASFQNGTCAC
jgi:hypothetical protein